MKKKLAIVLACTFAFGIAGTSLAAPANPFGDVPAAHWSYDAVNKLLGAGIVDGYNDRTFRGDQPLTRYEMAQIVARAMWNAEKADADTKILIDKLSAEYAVELDNLGVRVAKLEKKSGSIAVSGDARLRWVDNGSGDTQFAERLRINFKADVNDTTSFYGRFVGLNQGELGTYNTSSQLDRFHVADAAFTTKDFYGTTITVGRFSQQMDIVGGYWMNTTGGVDGVKISAGKELKVTAGFANFGPYYGMGKGNAINDPATNAAGEIKDAYFLQAFYPTSKATTIGGWIFKEKSGADSKFDVKAINVSTRLAPKWTLAGDYGKNSIETNGKEPKFQHTRLTYGNTSFAKPGSWSLATEYVNFEKGVNNGAYTASMVGMVSDVKGWSVIGSTAVAKNIILTSFYSFDIKKDSTDAELPRYVRFQLDYMF